LLKIIYQLNILGIIGGALSLATQTYRGFNENGLTGAFTGMGKGAVGTVSKPIIGIFVLKFEKKDLKIFFLHFTLTFIVTLNNYEYRRS
jgi:hypothetical protein